MPARLEAARNALRRWIAAPFAANPMLKAFYGVPTPGCDVEFGMHAQFVPLARTGWYFFTTV